MPMAVANIVKPKLSQQLQTLLVLEMRVVFLAAPIPPPAMEIDCTAGIECFEQTTCEANGHTGCCLSGCNTGSCYCDSLCHIFENCL